MSLVLDSGEQVLAHKAVLAAASPMFRDMFAGKMHEPVPTRLHVGAVNVWVLGETMRYMYTGSTSESPARSREDAVALLALAGKFQLQGLKLAAEVALVNWAAGSTGSAAVDLELELQALRLAESYKAGLLQEVVLLRLALLSAAGLARLPSSDLKLLQDVCDRNTVAAGAVYRTDRTPTFRSKTP